MKKLIFLLFWLTPFSCFAESALDAGAKGAVGGLAMGLIGVFIALIVWAIKKGIQTIRNAAPVAKELAKKGAGVVAESAHEFATRNKKCPFCAETIKTEAVVCKYCHRDLPETYSNHDSIRTEIPDSGTLNTIANQEDKTQTSHIPVSNLRQLPRENLGNKRSSFGEIRIFGFDGRMGRLRFLSYGFLSALAIYLGFSAIAMVMMFVLPKGATAAIALAAYALLFIIGIFIVLAQYGVRRLHDLNQRGWLWLLAIVPLANVIFGIYLIFAPGGDADNLYGSPPPPNTTGVWIGALCAIFVSFPAFGLLVVTTAQKFSGGNDFSRIEHVHAKKQIEALSTAVDNYRIDMGAFPSTEQGLGVLFTAPYGETRWRGPYLRKQVPLDPWGNPYQYKAPGERGMPFEIRSLGRDGLLGGANEDEDVTNY